MHDLKNMAITSLTIDKARRHGVLALALRTEGSHSGVDPVATGRITGAAFQQVPGGTART